MIRELLAELRGAHVFFAGIDDVDPINAGAAGRDTIVDLDRDLLEPAAEPKPVREVLVLAKTPADLRRIATLHKLLPPAERVVVAVLDTPAAHPAPVPTPTPAHRWRSLTDLRVYQPKNRIWVVDARFSASTPSGRTVTATARAFAGHRLDVITAPAAAIAGVGAADWRPGDPNATPAEMTGPVPERVGAPGSDMVLRMIGRPGTAHTDGTASTAQAGQAGEAGTIALSESTDGSAGDMGGADGWHEGPGLVEWAGDETPIERPTIQAASWERLGRPGMADSPLADPDVLGEPSMIPPVDERLVNPMGFVTTPSRGMASLAERDGRWSVVLDGKVVTSFAESGGVTDADVARLRQVRGVEVDWRHAHSGPLTAVRVLAGLATAGVPLVADVVPRWAGALGNDVIELVERCPDLADELRREEHSIRLRRAALRMHGVAARWEQMGAPAPAPPLTSVLLATRRTDMVSFALDQIARQRDVQLEVILALHGVPKGHPDVAAAIAAYEGPLTVYEADHQTIFGEVLNEAAARASGSFLLKMDDDDWYGPDFLSDLLLAHSYSGAQVVGTVPEFVYLSSIDVTVHRQQITEQITSFVAGGTILVERSAFQAVGGFRPLRRSVDTQFQEALQAAGGQIYRTHGLGYILRRGPAANHTWQEPIGTFLQRNRRQWRGFRPNALMELDGSLRP
ncbi:glycosyltransferase family 2 protein [Nonomuraea turkmeniaca]|uniref:Glycosyltransferase family 2 protein n=1 Tax=Nonomuraea turkmeniaca TaxID=103838 RepID=A0A5S4F8Q3_9ACTN|nr:glycosyltransferase [Nonomuraea turkmeniaca]TMR13094.1 glycosyltransferase family 2 protein [Nonomuraea turkmeniaca]